MRLIETRRILDDTTHEIQIGSFKVIGRFPLLVVSFLNSILSETGGAFFVNGGRRVQVVMDELSQEVLDLIDQTAILVLDPMNLSHRRFANTHPTRVSWFSLESTLPGGMSGSYLGKDAFELLYVGEGGIERYRLLSGFRVTRELVAAVCATREAGVKEDVVRAGLTGGAFERERGDALSAVSI